MCKLCMRFDVRKVDYKTDEKLRSLLEDICEKDEYQSLGIISFLEPNGRPGSTAAVEEHCIKSGIAFDRWCEANQECAAQYRIYRPGKNPIDAIVDVDVEENPYVRCDTITEILTDKTLTDKEKVRRLLNYSNKVDFPCPLITDYRSSLETAGRSRQEE